jgi:hypothetical protein
MDIEQYKTKFLEACGRAKRLGYDQGDISSSSFSKKLLVGRTRDSLETLFHKVLGPKQPEMIAGNCLGINLLLKSHIENELHLKTYFTLGSFQMDGKRIFEFTEDDIKLWLQSGVPDITKIDIHAWLTLESLEIIDATLPTSWGIICDSPELVGGIIHEHPSELRGNVSFHPVIVGHEILPDIGAIAMFGLE